MSKKELKTNYKYFRKIYDKVRLKSRTFEVD